MTDEPNFSEDLLKNEKILWKGQPDTSVIFNKKDIFLIPFSLMWGGFAIVWEFLALQSYFKFDGQAETNPPTIFFPLWGIPFVIIGIYFIFGRFIYKRKKKEKTWYLITNKRILVFDYLFGKSVESAYIETIPSYHKSINSNGIGTLTFGNSNWMSGMYANTGMDFFSGSSGQSPPTFHDINDAERVYRVVHDVKSKL